MCVRGRLAQLAESENEALVDRRRCFRRPRSLGLDASAVSEESGARSAQAPIETGRRLVGSLCARPGRQTSLLLSEQKSWRAHARGTSARRISEHRQINRVEDVCRSTVCCCPGGQVDCSRCNPQRQELKKHVFPKLRCVSDLRCTQDFTCRG